MKFEYLEVDVLTGETRRFEIHDPDALPNTPITEVIDELVAREGGLEVVMIHQGGIHPNGPRFVSIVVDEPEPMENGANED